MWLAGYLGRASCAKPGRAPVLNLWWASKAYVCYLFPAQLSSTPPLSNLSLHCYVMLPGFWGRIGVLWNSGKLLGNGLKNDRLPHVSTVFEEVHCPWLMASPLCTMPFKIFFFPAVSQTKECFQFLRLYLPSLISGGSLPCVLMIVHILKPFWLFSAATAVFQNSDTGECITSPCSRRFPGTSVRCLHSPTREPGTTVTPRVS